MQLPRFEYYEPGDIREAITLKRQLAPCARFLAGGTDLLVHLKKKIISADQIISLQGIPELTRIDETDSHVFIGACATMAQISQNPVIREKFCALKSGADNMGTHLIRNRATIGGNVCNASPAGDTLPALMIYQAVVCIDGQDGERQIPIESFFKGPGKTDMKPDEILKGFRLPIPPAHSGADYIQLGKRKSSEINLVNVASFLSCDPHTFKITSARIALGSVAPTPVRALTAEAALTDNTAEASVFTSAGEIARFQDCSPIDDFRGSAGYRRAMVGILTRRTLAAAFTRARG